MQKLCDAIEVDPADVLMLVFAWCLGASQMGYFSREEWLSAVGKVGDVTSEAELKERPPPPPPPPPRPPAPPYPPSPAPSPPAPAPLHLPQERVEEIHKSSLRESEALRELHQYAHKFCREERKKNIDVSRAPLTPCGRHAPPWTRTLSLTLARAAHRPQRRTCQQRTRQQRPRPRRTTRASYTAARWAAANPHPQPSPLTTHPHQVGSACIMLKLLLEPLYEEHVESLSRFLEQHAEVGKRGVSMDEWTMLLQFCREIAPDCDNFQAMLYSGHALPHRPCVAIQLYSYTELYTVQLHSAIHYTTYATPPCLQDDGAWPLLLDDYVEWRREQSAEGAESRE